jgi:hypothetical protein
MAGYSAIPLRISDSGYTNSDQYKYITSIIWDKVTVTGASSYNYNNNVYTILTTSSAHNFKDGDSVLLNDENNNNLYTGYWIIVKIVSTTQVVINKIFDDPFGTNDATLSRCIKYKMSPDPDGEAKLDLSNTIKDFVTENLEDANGRAIWALGEFISFTDIIDVKWIAKAKFALEKSLATISTFQSPRAIAFSIKGLYFYNNEMQSPRVNQLIISLADNLVSKYRGVSDKKWQWYEEYLTYANGILPEAMLYASLSSGSLLYESIAKNTFHFLLALTFKNDQIEVISNQGWYQKGKQVQRYGEQPIDVAYTIMALQTFYQVFEDPTYKDKMKIAFDWFLGKNHLHQIIYNPITGGCCDGLEQDHVNFNQGAESTISYLLSRLAIENVGILVNNHLQLEVQNK